jgi:hypothetical protein
MKRLFEDNKWCDDARDLADGFHKLTKQFIIYACEDYNSYDIQLVLQDTVVDTILTYRLSQQAKEAKENKLKREKNNEA